MDGVVEWDYLEKGYQRIFYYTAGVGRIDTGIEPYLYISPDMKEFALELENGRIIATNDAVAVLKSLHNFQYALAYGDAPDHDPYPYFRYEHS